MYDVFSDLMNLYQQNKIEPCAKYREIAANALDGRLAYSTPAMFGLTATLFSSDKMVAYNLMQNSIDEAKGAARVCLIADRYAPPELQAKMKRHVADEMKHSKQFLNLVPLTSLTVTEEPAEEGDKELAKVLDFEDSLQTFLCRVHSIEIRSWTMLRLYMKVIEAGGRPNLQKAIAVLENIMADEITHVLYTGQQINEWLLDEERVGQALTECFSHTNRETWHDMAFMSNYLADNFSSALA